MYLGQYEINDCFLGGSAVTEAYLGTDLVYSSGPFVGLNVKPASLDFIETLLENEITIKSSENWTLTTPAWLTASTLTGGTGETVVGFSASTQTASTSGTVEITTTSFSAAVDVNYYYVNYDYGDIIVYDSVSQKLYSVTPANYPNIGSQYTPIAVVIDPYLYLAMGLNWLSKTHPDTGDAWSQVEWGPNSDLVPGVASGDTVNDARNDYRGKQNTNTVLALATAQPNWRTDPTLDFAGSYNYTGPYYPLFEAAWRYHTSGTSQGDWYVPALGEVFDAMANHLTVINTSFNLVGGYLIDTYMATSTQGGPCYFWGYNWSRPNITANAWGKAAKTYYCFWGWSCCAKPVLDVKNASPLPSQPVPPTPSYDTEPLTFNILAAGDINWTDPQNNHPIEYTTDNGTTWTSVTAGTPISVSQGDVVSFRGDNSAYYTSNTDKGSFSGTTAYFDVEGNILSMIDSTGYTSSISLSDYALDGLFQGCTGLESAEHLYIDSGSMASYAYAYLFRDCTSLTTPPELPATTLAVRCYSQMFYGCTSLTSAPALPATTLADSCYYGMFQNCYLLTTAPVLPATTLVSNCYNFMFRNCSVLSSITCLATNISSIGTSATKNWVNGIDGGGTFYKDSSVPQSDWPSGANGIPTGWSVQDA